VRDKVTFKKVIANNWKSLVNLDLAAGGGDIAASNLYSTDEAQFDPYAHPRVVYTEKRDAGFMMYNVKKTKVKAPEASISLYDRSEEPRQRLWPLGAEQGSGEDPNDHGDEHNIDPLYVRKSGCEVVLHYLRLRGDGVVRAMTR